MPEGSVPLRWSAYEHAHVERGADWYWALGTIAVSISIICVLLNDALFGVIILVAAFILGHLATRAPTLVEFELSDRGIRVGEVMHKYEEIISFWVEDHNTNPPLLLIDTQKFMSPNVIIPIENIDHNEVRAFLQERVEEVPMREPISHKILEFFGI